MTSYQVVAPIFLCRFQKDSGVFFRAWSPSRYGPIYTYDIIIEEEDNQHPSMNMEYVSALQRVMDHIDLERKDEQESTFVDMTTDFHCPISLDKRTDELYIVTLRDSPFSPVFFLKEDVNLYLEFLEQQFVTIRSMFRIHTVEHEFI